MSTQAVSRRHFLKVTSIAGSSMLLGFHLSGGARAAGIGDAVFAPNAYLSIDSAGLITLMSPNPEIGQGIKTALPMILAEELSVGWDKIVVDMAPLDPSKYGSQSAGGSGAIRGRFTDIRKAGATARVMLINAAAQNWNVPVTECIAEDGAVLHKTSGKKASYGELSAKAASMPVPAEVTLKDPKDFKIIGTRVRNIDNKKIITGKPLYGIDTRREGMLYAMVVRPPAFGKVLKSFDDTETRKVTGVKNVVRVKNVVAVLADCTWAAKKGKEALKAVWEDAGKLESTTEHEVNYKDLMKKRTEKPVRNDGNVDEAMAAAANVLEAVYEVPALSHSPMEPTNFFAHVSGGKAELFGPTQVPGNMRGEVARELGIPQENVTLAMPRQGGGFGRKLRPDNGVEAALISAAAKAPVQMLWTREDDIQGDFYRPSGMFSYRAAIGPDNQLAAWHITSAALNSGRSSVANGFPAAAIPNFRADNHNLQSNIATGPWRAPTSNAVAFADESFMDEIARAMKKDPVQLRLELLDKAKSSPVGQPGYDADKLKGVISLVAEMSSWGKSPKGVFQGFAAHFSFSTYVAQVAEVKLFNGKPRVTKVYCAVNCGRVVNLSGAEGQIEGAIIDGLSHALHSEITFDKGATEQTNFHNYKFARMNETPFEIVVKFMQTDNPPTGLGEPGLPPIAPAVANAIFAATGNRIRKMPFNV
ncbi:xanthine dehydrogenase family protein molybdopterin-binding subunit [Hufsiella ginkgonis]|uniref:Molybdopterin-dependent oxidoreductase n=1 Tax=Hufsiella ginkgonis TaxID=2695274 RepID=A0A7K1XYP9_9SPHI|nr:molybdopterin cofactor-binding domain-containing protein [Hufsiella ginkgonis]MXV16072.1 molybdopterin-dependent oxidoreductase [Hufsiella ginkgonis]